MKKMNHILFRFVLISLFLSAATGKTSPWMAYDGYPKGKECPSGANLPSVTTKIVTQITATTATTGGTVYSDGGAPVLARGVCWSTSQNPTIEDSHTVDGTGAGSFSSSITGLTPGQRYYVRAYATNSVGTSYGEELHFVTNCIPYETWDTLRISPTQLPLVYGDTVIDIITSDSIVLTFNYLTMFGCDSTAHVKIFPTSTTATACFEYSWYATGETYYTSGTYYHPFSDGQGHTLIDTLYLTIHSPEVAIQDIPAVSVCENQTITLSANATGNSNISYNWTGPGNFTNTNDHFSLTNATTNMSGLYTVTASVTEGSCINTVTKTVDVTVHALPEVHIQGDATLCQGESTTLTTTGANTYIWNGGATGNTITRSPAVSMTYSVTGTDIHGCQSSAMVFVTVHELPNIGLSGHNSLCQGESTQLTASGGVTYVWSTGSTSAGILVSPSTSTSYTVTGTDANGCSNTAGITVTVGQGSNDVMTVTACEEYTWYVNGQTYTQSGSYPFTYTNGNGCESTYTLNLTITHDETNETSVSKCDSYTWGVTHMTYTESGTYTHTATSATGCEITDILHLTINHGNHTEETQTVCEPFTWLATGQTFSESGTHVFEYTNESGCPSSKTLHLTVLNPSVTVGNIPPITVCEDQTISFSASATGTGDISYEWSGPDHFIGTGNQVNLPNATAAMDGVYTVTATAQEGNCTATATKTVSVTVFPLPSVGISGGGSICSGETVTLGASGAVTYLWNNGSTGATFNESPSDSRNYSVTGTDANGCSASATAFVTVHQLPNVFILGGAIICKGESVTLSATGAISYHWSNGSTGNSITESPAESTTYTVMGVDANSCRNYASVSVTVNELPVVVINGDDDICEGESTELTASGAKTYEWSTGSTSKTILVEPTENTTYSVTGTDENNCSNDAMFSVTVGEWSEDTVYVTACETYHWHVTGENYTHSGTYPHSYTNESGCLSSHTLILTITHDETHETTVSKCDSYTWSVTGQTYTESGEYSYSYLNDDQCVTTEILHLTIHQGNHSEETVQECDSYRWPVNDQTYSENGNYVFEYTNANGCPSSKTLHLTLKHGNEDEVSETAFNSYTWPANGMTYIYSGDYVHHYTNEEGCDSKITLHLTIKHKDPEHKCIKAYMEKKESCYPGKDGEAKIFIPDSLRGKCTIKWHIKDTYVSAEHVTGLTKGVYYVQVKANNCNQIIYQTFVEITKEDDCDVKVHISGPTNLQGDCNGIPSATFTATASGGKPPYTFSGWQQISSNTATKTITPGEGQFSVSCTVTDDDNNSGSDLLNGYAKKLECAKDPNEIKGPNGYSEENRFVNVTDKMNYTISFENDPEFAMAPASRVKVTYDVPDQQRISSFRLSDFGFGSFIFTVPSNASSYSQRLDVSDSLGVWVDVNAGIDILNHQLFWIFQSIDPATGAEPASSQMGFLPINDSLEHGEGYVSFYILPDDGLQTGDTVAAEALIVFDDNAPIATNVWTNTFDAVAPVSILHADMNAADSLYCTFSFQAQDDPGGSGVREVEVYVSVNNGDYTSIGSVDPDSTLSYALTNGIYYQFMSIATDNVGNREAFKPLADTSVNYNTAPIDLVLNGNSFYEYDPVHSLIGYFFTLDNDVNLPFVYELVSGEGDADNALFTISGNSLRTATSFLCSNRTDYTIRVRTTDIGGLSLEKSFDLSEVIQHETPVFRYSHEICMGGSVNFHGRELTASGTYIDTLSTVDGCDSVVILYLTVNPVFSVTIASEICQGDSLDFNGRKLADAGIYRDTLQTVNGCDSIATLLLTVHPVYNTPVSATICQGESYNFLGNILTEAGVYVDTLQSMDGCDSVVTLTLTVNPVYSVPVSHEICQGETYNFFGRPLTTAGVYDQTLQTVAGCDSVIILTLTVNPTYNTPMTAEICQGSSYTFFGKPLTESGTYLDTMQTVNGCDSIFTLTLTVNPVDSTSFAVTECDQYVWNSTTYTQSGDYTQLFSNQHGCDSVVTLHLTLNYAETAEITETACDSFAWNGQTYIQSGDYTQTFSNAAGCDSVVTLHLTINSSTTDDTTATACDSFTWHGITYTQSGNYTANMTNAVGCDSVVTLHLTILESTVGYTTATACDSFTWHGNTYIQSGDYTTHLTNAAGCDSVATLHLTINHPTTGDTTATACEIFTWHGITCTQSGDYTSYQTNAAGCDSVVTLHLTINSSTTGDTAATACDSFIWHGITCTQSGNYTTYMTNAAGCDSVVTLHLTILESTAGDTAATACESFTWHGISYTQSGNYTSYMTNAAGCDSVVTLHLTILESTAGDTTATACESFIWHGTTYTQSGDYPLNLTNANGCDSTATLHLVINQPTTGDTTANACENFTWHGTTYTQSGDYTSYLTNATGCDSVVTLHLVINQPTTGDTTASVCEDFTWHGITYTQSGDYTSYLTNTAGCDSVVTLHLTVNPTYDVDIYDTAVRMHEYVFGDFSVTPTTVGTETYDFQYSTTDGCDSVIHLILYVLNNDGVSVYGLNDIEVFPNPTNAVLNIKGENMEGIWIYNADGQLVYMKEDGIADLQQVDVTGFASGQYFVKVQLRDNRTVTRKFVVNRQ